MTTINNEGFDEQRGLKRHAMPRLLRLPEVEQITGLKKTQIFDAVQRGVFPKPVKILETGRAIAWLEDEIVEHVRSRIAARDQGQPAA
jgi:prophage regulatory protein